MGSSNGRPSPVKNPPKRIVALPSSHAISAFAKRQFVGSAQPYYANLHSSGVAHDHAHRFVVNVTSPHDGSLGRGRAELESGVREARFSEVRVASELLESRATATLTCLLNDEDHNQRWAAGMPPSLSSFVGGSEATSVARLNLAQVDVCWAGQHTRRVLTTADLAAVRGTSVRDIAVGVGSAAAAILLLPLIPVTEEHILDDDTPAPAPGRAQATRLPLTQQVSEEVSSRRAPSMTSVAIDMYSCSLHHL